MTPRIWAIVGPSGVGKTTLVRNFLSLARQHELAVAQAVSFTTRKPREGEVDGQDYHFINIKTLERMLTEGALAEHIHVNDTHYGFAKAEFDDRLQAGAHVLAIVEPHGLEQIKAIYPGRVTSVYLKPPYEGAAADRMRARGTPEEEIAKRRLLDQRIAAYENQADIGLVAEDPESSMYALYYLVTQGVHTRQEAA